MVTDNYLFTHASCVQRSTLYIIPTVVILMEHKTVSQSTTCSRMYDEACGYQSHSICQTTSGLGEVVLYKGGAVWGGCSGIHLLLANKMFDYVQDNFWKGCSPKGESKSPLCLQKLLKIGQNYYCTRFLVLCLCIPTTCIFIVYCQECIHKYIQ